MVSLPASYKGWHWIGFSASKLHRQARGWFLCMLASYIDKNYALQRQNAENLKQIFPEKEYRGLSPNFHIHVSVSELYIPRWVCLFCWRKYEVRSWEYINRSQTHECWNWDWGRAIPRKGIYKWNCRCSVMVSLSASHTLSASLPIADWLAQCTPASM